MALALPAPAGAAVLYGQTSAPGSLAISSHDFTQTSYNDSQGADDFTIPDGQAWKIDGVQAFGSNNIASGNGSASVFLYSNAGTAPGQELFHSGATPVGTADSFLASAAGAPTLGPGTYWVSVQTTGGTSITQRWFWGIQKTLSGNPAVWQSQEPGQVCTTYRPLAQCNFSQPPDGPDFLFSLNGTLLDSHFSLGKPSLRSRFSINQPATFLGPGVAVVKDAAAAGRAARLTSGAKKNVKRVQKSIAGAGTVNLPIKLMSRAKKKLRKGKKVKLRFVVTFTATGGVAYSAPKSTINLIPRRAARGIARID